MITKPKARKFRIRRNLGEEVSANIPQATSAANPQAPVAVAAVPSSPPRPNPADQQSLREAMTENPGPPRATPRQAPHTPVNMAPDLTDLVIQPPHDNVGTEIDAIRREGLTGRQLRMARRVAQKHGIAATSDFDAVRLLRAEGIDPFQRATMLDMIMSRGDDRADEEERPQSNPAQAGTPIGRVQLPQTMPANNPYLPSTEVSPAERRANDIIEIQRDIARRRRRKLALLLSRLTAFVFLPTLLAGWY